MVIAYGWLASSSYYTSSRGAAAVLLSFLRRDLAKEKPSFLEGQANISLSRAVRLTMEFDRSTQFSSRHIHPQPSKIKIHQQIDAEDRLKVIFGVTNFEISNFPEVVFYLKKRCHIDRVTTSD